MKKVIRNLLFFSIIFAFCTINIVKIQAGEVEKKVNAYLYVLNKEEVESDAYTTYDYSGVSQNYDVQSIGTARLFGALGDEGYYKGFKVFSADDTISFGYEYNGDYRQTDDDTWSIYENWQDEIFTEGQGVIEYEHNVDNGAVIIQKSYDGVTWITEREPIVDFFDDYEEGWRRNIFPITKEELIKGTFWRVCVIYEEEYHTSWSNPRRKIIEKYEFYTCYSKDTMSLVDIAYKSDLTGKTQTQYGFSIEMGGSSNDVYVSVNNGALSKTLDHVSYYAPGKYTVVNKTRTGTEYSHSIEITEGFKTHEVSTELYAMNSFEEILNGTKVDTTVYGAKSLSNIKIAYAGSSKLSHKTGSNIDCYGFTDKFIGIFLNLNYGLDLNGESWKICDDDYGKYELVNTVLAGRVGTGSLMIQKSTDGVNYSYIGKDALTKGLFAYDYQGNYGNLGDVLVYLPDGKEVQNGLYLKFSYCYSVIQDSTGTKKYYREDNVFYLAYADLEAVTFKNLTLSDNKSTNITEENFDDMDIYRKAETLTNNSLTTSGFKIDYDAVPTTSFSIKRDGELIQMTSDHCFTTNGKYEISMTTPSGVSGTRVIYVDKSGAYLLEKKYFGDGFIQGRRVFDSESNCPVYEESLDTIFNIIEVDKYVSPIYGEIKNLDNPDDSVTINSTRVAKSRNLKPGTYIATLNINTSLNSSKPSGDVITFTFRFKIIPNGTAPGPWVNKKSLENTNHETIFDANPKCYYICFTSTSGGESYLLFSSKEAALEYNYKYEKGTVELAENGTYRYTGKFDGPMKGEYKDEFELTEAINKFAEENIFEYYSDRSDQLQYTTLKDEVENVKGLDLKRSVYLFAPGEKEKMMVTDCLPIINDRKYCYVTPGKTDVDIGRKPFEFIQDKYKCDSSEIRIKDSEGHEFKLAYNKGVEEQLRDFGCSTGIITIVETNSYGLTTEYSAIYFKDGDNTTELKVNFFNEKDKEEMTFVQGYKSSLDKKVTAFSLVSAKDELDPYSVVFVSYTTENGSGKDSFLISEINENNCVWATPGEYTIKVVNRLGFYYTTTFSLIESSQAVIKFEGIGTEEIENIFALYGEKDVELPELSKKGYVFKGYVDENEEEIGTKISEILFKGEKVLHPEWEPKQVTVKMNYLGDYDSIEADYDSVVELPIPETEGDGVFVSWMRDGVPIENNRLVIDDENEIQLEAVFAGEAKPVSKIWKIVKIIGICLGILILVILVIVLLSVFVFKDKKKENANEKTDNSPNQSKENVTSKMNTDESEEKNEKDEIK